MYVDYERHKLIDQPGITVRRIRTISGGEEFCEVFLDDVRANLSDVVGGLNNGWKVTNGLLGFERLWSRFATPVPAGASASMEGIASDGP